MGAAGHAIGVGEWAYIGRLSGAVCTKLKKRGTACLALCSSCNTRWIGNTGSTRAQGSVMHFCDIHHLFAPGVHRYCAGPEGHRRPVIAPLGCCLPRLKADDLACVKRLGGCFSSSSSMYDFCCRILGKEDI